MIATLRDFLRLEAASGIILAGAALLAMILANSPLSSFYMLFPRSARRRAGGPLEVAKPLVYWINDGLMAIFFFLIGLEIKREVLRGELSNLSQAALPGIAAVGGMAIPPCSTC